MSAPINCTCPKTVRGHLSRCPILIAFKALLDQRIIEEAK